MFLRSKMEFIKEGKMFRQNPIISNFKSQHAFQDIWVMHFIIHTNFFLFISVSSTIKDSINDIITSITNFKKKVSFLNNRKTESYQPQGLKISCTILLKRIIQKSGYDWKCNYWNESEIPFFNYKKVDATYILEHYGL